MQSQPQLMQFNLNPKDAVYTPEWAASDIVQWFKPFGRILEPCKGQGAILKYLPGAEWCEISEGKDFFAWTDPVDWIITNPPYSTFNEWLKHSFEVSENVVFLTPMNKLFSGWGALVNLNQFGWMKHVRLYGTGTRLNFPMGNAIGAVHFVSGWWGDTSWSWYAPNNGVQPTNFLARKRGKSGGNRNHNSGRSRQSVGG